MRALVATNEAYKANPFETRYRLQLVVSVEHLARSRRKVNLEQGAADKAYEISRSAAPKHQAVLLARLQYLINSGRWKDNNDAAMLVKSLKAHASTHPETWMSAAYYESLTGEKERAAASFVMALERGGVTPEIKRMARQLNMEITEQ